MHFTETSQMFVALGDLAVFMLVMACFMAPIFLTR